MTEWLDLVENRSIRFSKYEADGSIKSKEEQVKDAYNNIKQKISTIKFVESELEEKRAFLDLRHELISKKPNIRNMNLNMILFLQKYLNKSDFYEKEPLFSVLNLLELVHNFITTKSDDDYEEYREQVKEAGSELFNFMARDTVAQTEQTIFALGSKSTSKMKRAFEVIGNYFLENDDLMSKDDGISFYEYKLNHALKLKVFKNMNGFTGSGATFRLENAEGAMQSFKNGFDDEIYDLFDTAFESRSSILNEIEGKTAAHMCALFNDFLIEEDSYKSRRLLRRCKERFNQLDLNPILKPHKMQIDYNNPCFYSDYIRAEEIQNLFWNKVSNSGNFSSY